MAGWKEDWHSFLLEWNSDIRRAISRNEVALIFYSLPRFLSEKSGTVFCLEREHFFFWSNQFLSADVTLAISGRLSLRVGRFVNKFLQSVVAISIKFVVFFNRRSRYGR